MDYIAFLSPDQQFFNINCSYFLTQRFRHMFGAQNVSGFNPEIPQSHIADQHTAQ